MTTPSEPHVKVTLQTIYDKQLDNEKLLVRTLERLDGLADVPDRLRNLEINSAKQETQVKDIKEAQRVAKGATISAIIALGTAVIAFFK
jgi:hypothetical protein